MWYTFKGAESIINFVEQRFSESTLRRRLKRGIDIMAIHFKGWGLFDAE
mgnify:CR=1 FL=1